MNRQTIRERLLASTMIGGAALLALASAAPAFAADQPTTVEDVVVTGSRIPQPNLTQTSPVNTIGATDVKLAGTTRVEDVVNTLPQAFASQGSTISNGSSGTATVNLRGMGAARTLVLVDGRRLGPGDPGTPAADINFIPAPLIERIDVLTGGASAVYGSDAVAGVVNFIMKKDFEGLQIDINHGFYQHNNHEDTIKTLLAGRASTNPAQFQVPSDNFSGGDQTDVQVTMGVSAPDGKGNIEVYAGYRNIKSILQKSYDYSECSLAVGTTYTCSGSSTSFPGRFFSNGGSGPTYTIADSAGTLRPFATATDQFNFAPYNYFQRPDERYTAGAYGHYEVNPMLDVYSQVMFMDDHSLAQIAPSGVFAADLNIKCNSPLFSADEVQKFCTNFGLSGAQNSHVLVARRNQEGGGRVDDRRHTDYRIVVGARGELDKTWGYDVYGQYSQSGLSETYQNDFSLVRAARATNVVNVGGVLTCQSVVDGTDPNCVPYQIFKLGQVTPAALHYLQAPGLQKATLTEQVVSGSVTGKLGDYGMKSPWAEDGVGVALGAEYRRESVDWLTDLEFSTGDLAGQGGPTIGVPGAYNVKEFFGEARIPLIQHKPLFEDLSVDLGYRSSDYSSSGSVSTDKVEVNWAPTNDFRIRSSYNKAVRAPNINELFTPAAIGLDGSADPCAFVGAPGAGNYTAAQCARTGVTAAQYGTIIPNPAGQYNGFLGGNVTLKPERSETRSLGLVLTPSFIPGFNATIDYFDIKLNDAIGGLGFQTIFDGCALNNTASLCALIHRAANGSLWLGNTGFIDDRNQNAGSTRKKGYDIQANYRWNLDTIGMADMGHVDWNMVGTYLLRDFYAPVPGSSTGDYQCVGLYGPQCGTPRAKWRHKVRATWATPWNVNASVTWRYIGNVHSDTPGNATFLDYNLGTRNYIDLAATWHVRDKTELRIGVNNVFDRDPPQIGTGHLTTGQYNGNTAPQVYDALGRYFFMGLTQNF